MWLFARSETTRADSIPCSDCLIKGEAQRTCKTCLGGGELVYQPERLTHEQSLAADSYYLFTGDSKMLPDTIGLYDHPAYVYEIIQLGSQVKNFYNKQKEKFKEQMNAAKKN